MLVSDLLIRSVIGNYDDELYLAIFDEVTANNPVITATISNKI